MSCSNQIICYTSPHLSLHVPFFFLLIILTHCYVIVYSFYHPPLQAYLQHKKSLSNIIHLSHRQIQIHLSVKHIGLLKSISHQYLSIQLCMVNHPHLINSAEQHLRNKHPQTLPTNEFLQVKQHQNPKA